MTTPSTTSPRADTSDREFRLTRVFNAPRQLVWRAWTEPAQLMQWWGPRGFTNTCQTMDVRPGGVCRFIMHGPDGIDYPNLIVYDEITPPERLVYTHGSGEAEDPPRFQVTVTLVEQGNQTLLSLHALFASAAAWRAVKAMGAVEDGNSTLDRLAEHLATR